MFFRRFCLVSVASGISPQCAILSLNCNCNPLNVALTTSQAECLLIMKGAALTCSVLKACRSTMPSNSRATLISAAFCAAETTRGTTLGGCIKCLARTALAAGLRHHFWRSIAIDLQHKLQQVCQLLARNTCHAKLGQVRRWCHAWLGVMQGCQNGNDPSDLYPWSA